MNVRADVTFKDDVDFLGEGFGEYSLCFTLQAPTGAVAVEVNLFSPFIGMVDPRPVTDVEESKDAVAVADDVALAEAAVRRLRADLRVRPPAQPPATDGRRRAARADASNAAPRSAS